MYLDKYSIYTIISESNHIQKNELNDVLEKLEQLKGIQTDKEAKEFIKQSWNISNSVNNFSIVDGFTISTLETYNFFNVVLKYDNLCESLNFEREVNKRSA